MSNETLNPSKVKLVNADMPKVEYSKVYGINLGVLFYDDGNIRYIGEVKDGKASGYGIAWYPSENDNRTCCDGGFVDGLFNSGEAYDTEGNSITASELKDILFEGEFVMGQGLSNLKTSEQVAQQTKNDEERDMIVERTQEGKAIAKLSPDFKEGRPKKFSKVQINHALDLLNEYSYKQVGQVTGISKSTLIRAKRK
ncbi:MAG: hypothetical protein NC412_08500 [Roseburia sp.]|nr:hypothetical protein [Roseburia sp.]MCM1279625.1 hypothetical protein [Robinsoniella sp.]